MIGQEEPGAGQIVDNQTPDDEKEPQDAATKAEKVRKWKNELEQAKKRFEQFHSFANKAVRRYLDDENVAGGETQYIARKRLTLFHSNVDTLRANLFAQIPEAEADRRFFDPADDVARVAAEIVTRVINNDMNDPQDQGNESLKAALQDKLIAGLGIVRYRYTMKEGPDPSVTPESLAGQYPEGVPDDYEVPKVKTEEGCEPVYTYWKDVLWGPCRIWGPDWMGFRSFMTKNEVRDRFDKEGGPKISELIPYGAARDTSQPTPSLFSQYDDNKRAAPEAEIWEIWDKVGKESIWLVPGYDQMLDEKDDLLELPGFFPTPKPLIANTTSSKFVPKPDYEINHGLYEEIDELETRIAYLTRAAKAVGVYDAANKSVSRMMTESVENELIPVDNWAIFSERGGLKGSIDWMPITDIVNALKVCVEQQQSRIEHMYQVTGLSDIIRGQASAPGTTAAEQKIKAQFASVRLQFQQDEFAEYVSDLMNIKVSIIRNLYDADRIIKLSNIMATPDAPHAQAAIALIKDPEQFNIRVVVKAESLMQKNMAAIKGERTEMLQGMAQFLGMIMPMIEQMPEAAPYLLQMLQFALSGFNGATEMEGIFDQFVQVIEGKLKQEQAQPKPNPEMVKAQAQTQGALAVEQAKSQGAAQLEQIKSQGAAQQAQLDAQTQLQVRQGEAEIQKDIEANKAAVAAQTEALRIAADERAAEADRQIEVMKIQAENERAAAKLASDEKIAADTLQAQLTLDREKLASQERIASMAAAAAEAKQVEAEQ